MHYLAVFIDSGLIPLGYLNCHARKSSEGIFVALTELNAFLWFGAFFATKTTFFANALCGFLCLPVIRIH